MANTCKSKPNGGNSTLSRLLLLLFLAGLQPGVSTHTEKNDQADDDTGLTVVIGGPGYVTVGVPSSIECDATNCPACNYSMSLDGQPSPGEGNVLSFTLKRWMETLTVTCTATDSVTKQNATVTRTLQVLVGPLHVSISGPDVINATESYTYSCNAVCIPACTYAWELAGGMWLTDLGNVVTITPRNIVASTTVNCKVANNVSGMFVYATKNINVTALPTEIPKHTGNDTGLTVVIGGPGYVTVGVPSSIECDATNCPACNYSMSLDGQQSPGEGNVLSFTLKRWMETLTVTCTATDSVTKWNATVTRTLQVLVGPLHVSISGPDVINATESYTYSCNAVCIPACTYAWELAGGTWLTDLGNVVTITPRNIVAATTVNCKVANNVSGMFVYATKNINVTALPTETPKHTGNDTGLTVVIGGPGYVTVGVPSSIECDATNCPACNYSMSLDGQPSPGEGNVLSFTLKRWMETLTVTCTATDSVTKWNATVTRTLQVLVGPLHVSISGPDVINATESYTYSCNAVCIPACTYAWELAGGTWLTDLGNVVTITPRNIVAATTINCKVANNVSGMFVYATKNINVTALPTEIPKHTGNDTGLTVVIGGPGYVTVGVPSSIECDATNCPACNYSMSLDGQQSPGEGNVLSFTLKRWMEALTVTCTATDSVTKWNATVTRTLQVLVGPLHVSISGPDVINATESYTYSCNAVCIPACTYAWELAGGTWLTDLGNVVTITPRNIVASTTVNCKVANNVSGMFVYATKNINVTALLTEIPKHTGNDTGLTVVIGGPGYVTVGVPSSIECDATNCPACNYSMSLDGQPSPGEGNVLSFTLKRWMETLTVTCTATDSVTKWNATVTRTLQVLVGPLHVSISGPDVINATESYTYSCNAVCIPACTYAWELAGGTWLTDLGNVVTITPRNIMAATTVNCKVANNVSGMFVYATKNINVTALPTEIPKHTGNDTGLTVVIGGPGYVTVGVPSSIECDATNCPACNYSMSLDGQPSPGEGNVLSFTLKRWTETLTVTCTATDSVTKWNATVTRTLQVLVGPLHVSISGPDVVNATESYTYSCNAVCFPACTYSWELAGGMWITDLGNVVTITPKSINGSMAVICKAANNVSGMFVDAVRNVNVQVSSHNLSTRAAETSAVLLLVFSLSAAFIL